MAVDTCSCVLNDFLLQGPNQGFILLLLEVSIGFSHRQLPAVQLDDNLNSCRYDISFILVLPYLDRSIFRSRCDTRSVRTPI